jgi:hypothetical protein
VIESFQEITCRAPSFLARDATMPTAKKYPGKIPVSYFVFFLGVFG